MIGSTNRTSAAASSRMLPWWQLIYCDKDSFNLQFDNSITLSIHLREREAWYHRRPNLIYSLLFFSPQKFTVIRLWKICTRLIFKILDKGPTLSWTLFLWNLHTVHYYMDKLYTPCRQDSHYVKRPVNGEGFVIQLLVLGL